MSAAAEKLKRDLQRVVCRAMPAAVPLVPGSEPDDELAAAMPAQLASLLGFVIAFIARGDAKAMDELLESTTQFVYEAAAQYGGAQRKIATLRPKLLS